MTMTRYRFRCRLAAAALALNALAAAAAGAQALPSLASVAVGYNTQKTQVKPAGDLKAAIDALDREIAEATRLGRTGELRRLYAKGQALLSGRAWTDRLDFAQSLVLRTDRVIVDPSSAWSVRLEQIYEPTLAIDRPLLATIVLRPAQGGAQAPITRDFGKRDGVARDLRESPLKLDLDLTGVADGAYRLVVDVSDGSAVIGSATRAIAIARGLDAAIARLKVLASSAPEPVRADILYPSDRIRLINAGLLPLAQFDSARELADAEAVATAAATGKDPFEGRTGDLKRHYLLESAGEIMPFRLYVPANYTPSKTWPLLIALHGLGGDENAFFDRYDGQLQKLAEQYGMLVAAPLGYRPDGWYGWPVAINRNDPEAVRTIQRSEDDVMQVLARMKRQYTVDDARIYLMGHSMGAIGTWFLAPKYPDVFAAIGLFAGIGDPASLERITHVPEFIVHGDKDATVDVSNSQRMVAAAKTLGIDVMYIEVAGGGHVDVVVPNLPAMFEFLSKRAKR
ncbi:MAG TPA: PHB depolymerase family esterase [Vicinamibacterales bacterium]|nr:PHB depolymerase family esterase [Vicinamibacterales bacterium]